MKPAEINTLTFDVAGTLIDFESGILNWFRPHLKGLGIFRQDEDILEAFARTEAHYLKILPESSFTEILPVLYSDMMRNWDHQPHEEDGIRFQNSVRDWPPFPDTVLALKELKHHYRLSAVTNSDSHFLKYMAERMGNPFDDAFTCNHVGVNKPDKKVFQEVLLKLASKGIGRSEILHVAQSQFHDIIPATEMGLASAWIHRRHNKPGFGATPEPYRMVEPSISATSMQDFTEQLLSKRKAGLRHRSGTFSLRVTFNQNEAA